jgi:7-cyano-7-deazaguanine reductase
MTSVRGDAVRQDEGGVLGREVRGPIGAEQLVVVPWSHGETDATVEFTTNELTATCPITGQPDFYELKLSYRPRACDPAEMTVDLTQQVRGGLQIRTVVKHPPAGD